MQMVAVAIVAKATWNWVRGKREEAGRGVQAGEVEIPVMAAEAGRGDCQESARVFHILCEKQRYDQPSGNPPGIRA
jgi:hypothetical protein